MTGNISTVFWMMSGTLDEMIYINPEYEKVWGRTCESLYKDPHSWTENIYPDDRKAVIESYSRLVTSGFDEQYRIVRPDGTIRWVHDQAFPVRDKAGEVCRIAGFARDITERKRAEAELRHLSSRHEAILTAVPDIIMEVDANKVYRWANHAGYQFFGEGVIGKEASYFFEGEQATYDIITPLFHGEEDVIYLESWQMRKDNEKRLLAWWCRALKDENGQVVGVLSTARDITEQKRAEEAQRESEEMLQAIIDNSTTVIYVKDVEGRYLLINAIYEKLFGVDRDKVVGMTDHDVFPEEVADELQANDRSVVEKRSQVEFEEVVPHEDGPHTYLSVKFPLVDASGVITGVCGISTDITEFKRMGQESLKTQKLESLGVLAGGIAHDFNNLLTGIIGNISLLAHKADKSGETHRGLGEMEKAASRAQELTQQLLTFAKGGDPVKEVSHIGGLIEEACRFCLSGSNVKCDTVFADDLLPVEVDMGQLSQVINNLIINAKQAMPDGGNLKVSVRNRTVTGEQKLPLKEGRYVMISVEDYGEGIPGHLLSKIFDPYFTTKKKGNGLGLASSYSIVMKHGGHIAVSSELGVGSTFRVYLPVSHKGGVVDAVQEAEPPRPANGRILVMDDEEIIRDVVSEILTTIGYEVRTSTEGNEAMGFYKEAKEGGEPFDAVIMDLTIPGGMGGMEAIKRFLEYDPKVKAVVSSGYSNDPIMADFKKYGFSGVITKPYKISELGEKLHDILTK